jgi:two-component system, OmpR family, response regulator RegX3
VATRILFVEDERSIYEPFSKALTREGFEPVVAPTAKEALELARRIEPDVVLLDLNLPDGDGRDVARELRRMGDVPILMLTARDSEMDRVTGLEIGADDYVVKPFSSAEVIARIRAVLRRSERGGRAEGPSAVDGLEVDPGTRSASIDGRELDLTRKEFDLLARLIRDTPKVVTREELMASVWDVNWFGSTKTLDVHIGTLRRKLGEDPARPRRLHTVRGVGFRIAGPGDAEG